MFNTIEDGQSGIQVALNAGNPRDFKTIYDASMQMLFKISYRIVNDEEAAEDLVHDSLIKANEKCLVFPSLNDAKFSELKSFSDLCQSTILNAGNLAARNRKRKNEKLSKHASHLIRLLRMGSEILETGEINTYRENDRDLLLEIKNGKWFHESADGIRSYDDAFWDLLNEEEARFKYAKENTNLPNKPDQKSAKEYVNNIHEVIVIGEADAF